MEAVTNALWELLAGALSAEHWPFLLVCSSLAVIGQIMSQRVFTRYHAYLSWGRDTRGRLLHMFFWWGRESLPGHPIMIGLLILPWAWPDPEGQGWPVAATAGYWTFCGVASLFVWVLVKGFAKHRGIELELPGDSSRPPAGPGLQNELEPEPPSQ